MPGATKAVLEDESARASPTTYAGEARLGQLCAVVGGAMGYISRTILRRKLIGVLFNGRFEPLRGDAYSNCMCYDR